MDLRAFISLLEREGELARVRPEVDPYLEMAEIADRASKAHGPAVLFEQPKRPAGQPAVPVLMNQLGSYRRLELALGAPLDDIAKRIGGLLELQVPSGLVGKVKALGQLKELASYGPRYGKKPLWREVVVDPPDLSAPAGAHHLARRRRAVHHPADRGDQGPAGPPERRHVPPAGLRRADDRHAHPRPPRRRRQLPRGGRPHGGGGRPRHRPGGHVRGHGAAPAGHQRVHVRRLPPRRAGRHGPVRHRRPAGAGRRRDRPRGLRREGRDAARGAVRRPHRLLLAGGPVPGVPPHGHEPPPRPHLPGHHRRQAADGGRLPGQGHRAPLPAAAAAGAARDRRHGPARSRACSTTAPSSASARSTRATRARS